jgi:hypothetical protein
MSQHKHKSQLFCLFLLFFSLQDVNPKTITAIPNTKLVLFSFDLLNITGKCVALLYAQYKTNNYINNQINFEIKCNLLIDNDLYTYLQQHLFYGTQN